MKHITFISFFATSRKLPRRPHACERTAHRQSVVLSVSPRSELHESILIAGSEGDVARLSRAARILKDPIAQIVDANGATALHLAAEGGSADAVAALFEIARGVGGAMVQYGHDGRAALALVQARDLNGATALHYAARSKLAGALGAAERLLRFGALVDQRDERGMSALDYAVKAGNTAVADRLRMESTL